MELTAIELSPDNDRTLNPEQREASLNKLVHWEIIERNEAEYLQRIFTFSSYNQALDFTYRLGVLCEEAGRYPALITALQKVTVMWHTEHVQAITANDVTLAEHTDQLFSNT